MKEDLTDTPIFYSQFILTRHTFYIKIDRIPSSKLAGMRDGIDRHIGTRDQLPYIWITAGAPISFSQLSLHMKHSSVY